MIKLVMTSTRKLLCSFMVLTFITGCFDDTSEIKAHMAQVKATTTNYIEPMPEVKPFNHIAYSADDLRSPFVLPQAKVIEQKNPADCWLFKS
jgi:type IV pilus assembly protein PilP